MHRCLFIPLTTVSFLLVSCGGETREQMLKRVKLEEEHQNLSNQVARLQKGFDKGLAEKAFMASQLEAANAELASLKVDAAARGGQDGEKSIALLEINADLQKQVEELTQQVALLKEENDAMAAVQRGDRRKDLIGTHLGTLVLEDGNFFEAKIRSLTPSVLEIEHKKGVDKFMLERLPENLQKRLAYDPAEARHEEELLRERRTEARMEEQVRTQMKAAAVAASAERAREAAVDAAYREKKDVVSSLKREISQNHKVVERENERYANARRSGKIATRSVASIKAKEKIEKLNYDLRKAMIDLSSFEIENGLGDGS